MSQIEELRRQIELEQAQLNEVRDAIATVSLLLKEEREYTEKLVRESRQKSEAIAPRAPQEPTLSKPDKIAQMSDQELLGAINNPEKREQLFKDL